MKFKDRKEIRDFLKDYRHGKWLLAREDKHFERRYWVCELSNTKSIMVEERLFSRPDRETFVRKIIWGLPAYYLIDTERKVPFEDYRITFKDLSRKLGKENIPHD